MTDSTVARITNFALIALAVAIGAWLRFDGLGVPSYWLDEILAQGFKQNALAGPWWHWLAGFGSDQGPLYFATQLVGDEFTGRLLPALFGVAAIAVLAWMRQPFAALLLAVSPLHVYYSREARPYALLMLLTALLIAQLLRETRDWPIVLTLVAMLLTHASAAPVVAAFAITAFLVKRERLAFLAAGIAIAFLVFYRGGPGATPHAPFPEDVFATIARSLTVSAFADDIRGRAVFAMLAFAGIGGLALWRRERRHALIVIAMTLLPIAFAVITLRLFGHWFAARYVCAGLIGFVLLVAAGIGAVSTIARAGRDMLALLIVLAIARETVPAARTEPFRKLDWRAVAMTLRENAKPGDTVLAAEEWSQVSLQHYLGETMKVISTPRVELAEMLIDRRQATWLVSAGYSNDGAVRSWMCRYPLVMSSGLEDFRLHFIGSQRELLQRARPATLRAAAASFRTILPNDDPFFVDGWAQSETDFRWAIEKRATVLIPRSGRRDGVIRVVLLPLPRQSMRVSLNGHDLEAFALKNEWTEIEIHAPASAWIDGLNTLAFDFAFTRAPGTRDERTLAASFAAIAVDDSEKRDRPLLPALRIDANRLLDATSMWPNTKTRFPAARLHRRNVEALLGRLGFDPLAAWPRLANGEIHLDDVVETIAYGSDCEDDRAFLHRAFAVLLERRPNDVEERDLLARLARGATREVIVGRIVKSGDFRALALSFASR
ncbi:MAG TPA: hypothetical protein VHW00_23095 [Thermoanaerobaculia bacterium]|nr:hypothetical protein [Thermoanaerobaculia bacterium]